MSQQWGQDPIFREERLYFKGGGSRGSITFQGRENWDSEITQGLLWSISYLLGGVMMSCQLYNRLDSKSYVENRVTGWAYEMPLGDIPFFLER